MSPGPAPVHEGKIRRLYDVGDGLLVMLASDRISAFDVVMAEPIPQKGRVLTAMTAFWCTELADVPNHLVSAHPAEIAARLAAAGVPQDGRDGRALLVRRAEMLPIECIVRGYLAGSAWTEYAARGTVHGMPMPAGLRLADGLPEPLFTPSTKFVPSEDHPEGHDENIDFEAAAALVGRPLADAAASSASPSTERRRSAPPARAWCWRTPSLSWAWSTGSSWCATRSSRQTPRACGRSGTWSPARPPRL